MDDAARFLNFLNLELDQNLVTDTDSITATLVAAMATFSSAIDHIDHTEKEGRQTMPATLWFYDGSAARLNVVETPYGPAPFALELEILEAAP